MYIITIIGAIASIIGAGFACWEASKAKGSADDAKRVRTQLIDHRKASELTNIQASCKRALESMKKYGPASTPYSLLGNDSQKDGNDVQDFIFLLKLERAHFGPKNPNEADEFCDVLIPLLEDFSNSSLPEDYIKYGKLIVINLSSITAAIKKRLDSKREAVH